MKICTRILLAVILLTSQLAKAQQQPESVLTLKDALNYSLRNNSAVNKSRLDIERARYVVEETRAQALPQLNVNGSITDQLIIPKLVFNGQVVSLGTKYNAIGQANFSQKLFDKQVFTGLQASQASVDFYRLTSQQTEENTIEQVASAYYQYLVTREQLAVVDSNINSTRRVEKIIATQYKNGLAKKIDLDRVQVNITNLNTQREQLLNAIAQGENTLKYYMGMSVNAVINIPQAELQSVKTAAARDLDSINTANLIDYKVLKKQEELLQYQKKAYQAQYYPSLSFTANYSQNGLSPNFDLFNFTRNSGAYWYGSSAIGLTLSIPVFDGFARRSRVREANVDILKIREDIRNTSNALNLAHKNAQIQINNSLNTISLQNANVRLANEVYTSTQNNYNNGLASLTDLLDAQNALVSAQNSYNQALLNYKIAEIELIKSNGNIKTLLN
ncbi:TolC family protein [Mucilaginibacter koreensis]